MANRERTGVRDLTISAWHRRVFGPDASAFDLDLVGMCKSCSNHLYAMEVTRAADKSTTWTGKTALRLNVPGYLITYSCDITGELETFTAQQIYPGKRLIGGQLDMKIHLEELRRAHSYIWHGTS